MQSDTIAAISTGMTNAGIGKIRLSGDDAVAIADRIYRSPGGRKKLSEVLTHTIHYGYIYDGDCMIDEVLVLIMRVKKVILIFVSKLIQRIIVKEEKQRLRILRRIWLIK